jgi:hypothetical protein
MPSTQMVLVGDVEEMFHSFAPQVYRLPATVSFTTSAHFAAPTPFFHHIT